METVPNSEVKFKRDYDDIRLFYESAEPTIEEGITFHYYTLNIAEVEKIANKRGMSQLEVVDYIMQHDISYYNDTLEYKYIFDDMRDEMQKLFKQENKRLEVQEKDCHFKQDCLSDIHDYMNELYSDKDQSFIDQLNDDQIYRCWYYINKGYTLSKILSIIEKPDI
ncbi:MAG: hypothetical protein LUG12_11725 [Erysipelotrichaceae bacterium]|nr:hypothetical protein [Erysipelotrichaceae bacterium]